MHGPALVKEVKREDRVFFIIKNAAEVLVRPREVASFIIGGHVSVLARVETSLGISEHLFCVSDNAFGGFPEAGVIEHGVGVNIISQQPRVVVGHFLEMRNDPRFIDGVPVEAACKLIMKSSPRHGAEGLLDRLAGRGIIAQEGPSYEKFNGSGHGKLGVRAETSVSHIRL